MPGLPSLGALVTTEELAHDLGTFAGRRLEGRVQRRVLRFALGRQRGLRVALTRLRPVSIGVSDGGTSSVVPVPVPRDPWLTRVGAVALLACVALLCVGASALLVRRSR
jgi:hypothetical protein